MNLVVSLRDQNHSMNVVVVYLSYEKGRGFDAAASFIIKHLIKKIVTKMLSNVFSLFWAHGEVHGTHRGLRASSGVVEHRTWDHANTAAHWTVVWTAFASNHSD